MLYNLQNPIQNYAWGSTTALTELFGIANPNQEPQAEVWMGAHPNGCSQVVVDGQPMLLSKLISDAPEKVLGEQAYQAFGGLPYLLKLLAAEQPLSVQVHPEKSKAQAGFNREVAQGIPLGASYRNFKDANHKPELVYALTPYLAMNAFRPVAEIVDLFEQSGCTLLFDWVVRLKTTPDAQHLQGFFHYILSLTGDEQQDVLGQLLDNVAGKGRDDNARLAFKTVAMLEQFYPWDIGLFSPLFLNVIELAPGEAMFLQAETPHAYLRGTGVEIMANSDNVLRAGLTPKHIDVDELIANTRFESIPAAELLTKPVLNGNVARFPVPVDDFKFEIITLNNDVTSDTRHRQTVTSAEILLAIAGEITVEMKGISLSLKAGESAFVEAYAEGYQVTGIGQWVRVSV